MKSVIIFISILVFASVAHSAEVPCGKLEAVAQNSPGFHPPLSATVKKLGRTYFHSAPSSHCKESTFIVKGDSVIVYTSYKRWMYVMFVNLKTGEDFSGWVPEGNLKILGKFHQ